MTSLLIMRVHVKPTNLNKSIPIILRLPTTAAEKGHYSTANGNAEGRSHRFRSEGDKSFRDLLSELSSSHIHLHLCWAAKLGKPHKHKQNQESDFSSLQIIFYQSQNLNTKLPNCAKLTSNDIYDSVRSKIIMRQTKTTNTRSSEKHCSHLKSPAIK